METQTLALVKAALAPTELTLRNEYTRLLHNEKDTILKQLEVDGWDAEKNFSFPRSTLCRKEYGVQRRRFDLCEKYTHSTLAYRTFHGPNPREENGDNSEVISEKATKLAKEALEGYCQKLALKIDAAATSPVLDVVYEGNLNPWGFSTIRVKLQEGHQAWETKMIVNQSCLGKVFNQWPTRLIA